VGSSGAKAAKQGVMCTGMEIKKPKTTKEEEEKSYTSRGKENFSSLANEPRIWGF